MLLSVRIIILLLLLKSVFYPIFFRVGNMAVDLFLIMFIIMINRVFIDHIFYFS